MNGYSFIASTYFILVLWLFSTDYLEILKAKDCSDLTTRIERLEAGK